MKELSEDFHFCKEQPPQSFYENLQLTNRLSEEVLTCYTYLNLKFMQHLDFNFFSTLKLSKVLL